LNKTKQAWSWFKSLSLRKQILIAGSAAFITLVLIALLTYAYFARDISNRERLMNRKNTGVMLLDRHGEPIYSFYQANYQDNISLSEIPEATVKALIATEDKGFYEHSGYSIRSILAAFYSNLFSQDLKKYGGSTITQQLVKNVLLSNEKSFFRKYQELSLAIAIERHYEKDEILEMYLNSVYFGEGAFGIESAAKTYFNKPAAELNLAESSLLIGLLPAPSALSPISGDLKAAKERQEHVVTMMVDERHIDETTKNKVLNEKLKIASNPQNGTENAHHFALMVIEQLKERYGEEKIIRSGYTVTTTLDLNWQKSAEKIAKEHIATIASSGANNASLVAIDPKTGDVKTLVGSVDWFNKNFGKVNMATTPRQPGSSFKPIYYSEAIDKKIITAATILKDEPTTFGNNYRPVNYDFAYRGDVTVRKALANSLNIPSVQVMEKLGVSEALNAAKIMGISNLEDPSLYGLSLALGTGETKLIDMTSAYSSFANSGLRHEPNMILNIKNKYQKEIFKHKSEPEQVMSEPASFIISSILSDNNARTQTFGSSLNIDRVAAVKTGTTEDNKDALTIGYTPQLATGVWVGNNQNEPMNFVGGSTGAAPIWKEFMTSALTNEEKLEFSPPEGVTTVHICTSNGLLADYEGHGTIKEHFIEETVPKEKCQNTDPKDNDENKKEEKENEKKEKKKEEESEEEPVEEEPTEEEEEPPEEEEPVEEEPTEEEEP
jgi:1A family penicillin-binding protein